MNIYLNGCRNASQTSQRSARSTPASSRRSHQEGEGNENDRPASIYPIIPFTQPKEYAERELNYDDVPKIR